MTERIIRFSIQNKFIVGLFVVALIAWGSYSLTRLPIDAIPDITNNQVQIISLAPSLAVQEVESFITAPIEVAVANIPEIIELRSISRLGLSVVTVVFHDGTDIYWARQQLGERLREAEEVIPAGMAKIELAPISSGLGEIFQYRLAVAPGYEKKFPPMELRTIQDWIVRRSMLGTPGVADINSYGGFVKQYEISVNPERLRGMNLHLTDIFTALEKNNENTGSAYIDKKPTAYFIRGIGLVRSLPDIEKIVVSVTPSGIPVLIRDLATVRFGSATRYGAFVVDTAEAVGGVVMMLKGANAHEVIDRVEERIATIQGSLPAGVKIEPFLDRSDLVNRAIGTVGRNLIEGALIVLFILVLLLGNLRAGLIVASVIPLSMLFAISMMNLLGVSGNLMSLGAIDFGLIVDGAVIIVESVIFRIAAGNNGNPAGANISVRDRMDQTVFDSAKRMMSSATFGQIIILIVYLPIMALIGIEGKMFRPMAQVVAFAILGAAILSLTYVPMASALFLSPKPSRRITAISEGMMAFIHRAFDPVITWSLSHKATVVVSSVVLFLFSLLLFSRLGGEFIPQLEEGDLAAGVITLQGGSLTNTVEMVIKANKILLENFPEIKHAVCKIGAGEIPTDPTPMETGDYIITLKDKSEWTSAETREELVSKMEEKLVTLAGVKFEFQQPIQMRFNELMSGSKQDIAVKLFGDDLNRLAEKASEIERIAAKVDGVEDINVEKVTGLAQVQVDFNRDRIAQYGLSVADVNRVLRAAFAGSQAGVVYEEEKRFALVVRLDRDFRQSLDDVRNLTVALPDGSPIPLEQIADVSIRSGPAQVSREDTKRRITIGFNVRNRDVQGVIDEVSARIAKEVKLPTGYYVSYGGQFRNFEAAKNRLAIAVPAALLLIFVLLYFAFHSAKQALLIFSAVPLSAIGGILALWARDMNFSISAGVGFIALFGVAVLNGIVLLTEFNRLEAEGVADIRERVLKGLKTRLRPVVMTATVASLGFLPMALSTSAGAEVQKPLATVVIGGLITATLLTLIVLPVLYVIFRRGFLKKLLKTGIMKGSAIILLVIVVSLFYLPARAGDPRKITLRDAIGMALDSNRSVKAAEYALEAEIRLKNASWDIPKTVIDGQYGQFNSYRSDNSFSISQQIAFPSVYINQNRLAKAQAGSAGWQLKSARLDIADQVRKVYWQVVYLQARRKLLVYQDSLYAHFSHAAELRARSGETNRLEMITAHTQSRDAKNQLDLVDADIGISLRKLQTLMGSPDPVEPADSALHRIGLPKIADSSALRENPSLGYLHQQTEIEQISKHLEQSRMLPDLIFSYMNQSMTGTQEVDGIPRNFGAGDRFTSVQAGISLPLWFGPGIAKSKAASLRERVSKTNAEYYSGLLRSEYNSLLDQYRKYAVSLDYFEQQAIPEATMIIEQASRSYHSGALDYLDYVTSLNRALDIRQRYLDALNDYNQTLLNIEYITGNID